MANSETLLILLRSDSKSVRANAAKELGKTLDPTVVEHLLGLLKDETWEVRLSVVEALENIGSDSAVDGLIRALGDEKGRVKARAATALGNLGSKKAVGPLIRILVADRYPYPYVKIAVVDALGMIGDKRAIKPIVSALKTDYRSLCNSASSALGRIGGDEVGNALMNALKDRNAKIRRYAATLLRSIAPGKYRVPPRSRVAKRRPCRKK